MKTLEQFIRYLSTTNSPTITVTVACQKLYNGRNIQVGSSIFANLYKWVRNLTLPYLIISCFCFRLIHPVKYFNDYVSRDIRPDGRKFHEQRNIRLNVSALQTADASAVVKCGNTTVVCGIKLVRHLSTVQCNQFIDSD